MYVDGLLLFSVVVLRDEEVVAEREFSRGGLQSEKRAVGGASRAFIWGWSTSL